MLLVKRCPICKEVNILDLTEEETQAINNNDLLIQEALPNRTAEEREIAKTGICGKCWKIMFDISLEIYEKNS